MLDTKLLPRSHEPRLEARKEFLLPSLQPRPDAPVAREHEPAETQEAS